MQKIIRIVVPNKPEFELELPMASRPVQIMAGDSMAEILFLVQKGDYTLKRRYRFVKLGDEFPGPAEAMYCLSTKNGLVHLVELWPPADVEDTRPMEVVDLDA